MLTTGSLQILEWLGIATFVLSAQHVLYRRHSGTKIEQTSLDVQSIDMISQWFETDRSGASVMRDTAVIFIGEDVINYTQLGLTLESVLGFSP